MSLSLIPPTLPSDFCTLSTQEQANLLIDGIQVTGSVEGGIVFSTDEPGVDDRDKAWGLLNPDGTFTGKIFTYDDGFWGSEHPYAVSGDVRLIWTGIEADVWSFDGGDGVDPGSRHLPLSQEPCGRLTRCSPGDRPWALVLLVDLIRRRASRSMSSMGRVQ
jgi:hypothetical protein